MSTVINTNVMSLNAQRNLSTSQNMMALALQRLSSGLRVNSAKDDAAGFAIAQRFETQVRGLNQAIRNANDGISLAQTAEAALGETTANLQRIRELAVQANNGTNSASDLTAIQEEIDQRIAEITRIANQTTFNGTNVLDGTAGSITFQVGANVGDTIAVDLTGNDMTAAGLDDGAGTSVADIDVTVVAAGPPATGPEAAISVVDAALTTVSSFQAELGAVQNRFQSTISNLSAVSENLSASKSRIVDADFASETANLTKAQILQQAGIAVLAQANAGPQAVLGLLR